jgi:hypothetical protein
MERRRRFLPAFERLRKRSRREKLMGIMREGRRVGIKKITGIGQVLE